MFDLSTIQEAFTYAPSAAAALAIIVNISKLPVTLRALKEWLANRRHGKVARLQRELTQIDNFQASPQALTAHIARMRSFGGWMALMATLMLVGVLLPKYRTTQQEVAYGLQVIAMYFGSVILYGFAGSIYRRNANPEKAKALIRIKLAELKLRSYKYGIENSTQLLTEADMDIAIVPVPKLKSTPHH